MRGNNGWFDNKDIIAEIIKLRAEKAKLWLCYSEYVIADEMAQKPQAVYTLLEES